MAADEDGGKRHVWGPQSVGALVPHLTRPVFRKRAPASAQLLSDWDMIVGPQLAATTTPRRLSGSTLTVACTGPVALELQHMAGSVMARINGHLGRVVVDRLRFVQDPKISVPPDPSPRHAAPAIDLPGVPEGPLHDALTRLGQSVHLATRRR
jgi:hypothetical protein